MRILVNDIAASDGGAKSILQDFYRHLVESGDRNEWYFLLSEPLIEETNNIHVILLPKVKKSWPKRLWFDWVTGRKTVSGIAPDVVLSLQNTSICGCRVPQYLYIHQSLPFQNIKRFSFFKKEERIYAVYQHLIGFLIKQSAKRAAGVFVQTQWMKAALRAYLPAERICVLPPSLETPAQRATQAPQGNTFFYPANNAVYKNHRLIHQAVEALVEEGIGDFCVTYTLEPEQRPACALKQLCYAGKLSREAVMETYSKQILLFPSYIETFGLPLAEARIMRGMIFAADTPFAREILDGYQNAWFFDPFDYTQLKELMKKAVCGELIYHPLEEISRGSQPSWAELIDTLKV